MSTAAGETMHSSDRNDEIVSDTAPDEESINDGGDVEDEEQNHESDSPDDNSPASSPEKSEPTPLRLGGSGCTDGKPAYAVLTGIWTNNDDTESVPKEEITVTIPITNLPVVLGRRWGSKDKPSSHQALPRDEKMLSRLHACIFYRDDKGGKLGRYAESTEEMIYKPYDQNEQDEDSAIPENILRLPGWKNNASLPTNGFWAIENLARHTIRVGDKKLTKGKQAMLQDGMTIQIASYCFYFLLPLDVPPVSQEFMYRVKKQQHSPTKIVDKKVPAKVPEETKSQSSPNREKEEERGNEQPAAKKPRKSEDNLFSKLDNVSTSELFDQFAASADTKETTREDQLVSATLAIRIAREAAKDSNIQMIARDQHGVTQRDIIDWYNKHPSFSDFERLMLSKIEYKSYQSCMTKAIQRAGFTRNETNPGKSRCTRWDLPADIPLEPVSSPRHAKSPRSKSEDLEEKSQNEANEERLEDIYELKQQGDKNVEVKEESGGNQIDEDVPLSLLEKTATSSSPSET